MSLTSRHATRDTGNQPSTNGALSSQHLRVPASGRAHESVGLGMMQSTFITGL